ncbi:MAG: hypothetical protein WC833_03565 [Bacteroidales bacterium]|jgi:hypothetical protein
MKKIIIFSFAAISALLIMSSATTQSPYPKYIHKFDPETGKLLTKIEYGEVVPITDTTFTINYYYCPLGTEFSCDVEECVSPLSDEACDCVVEE